MRAEYAAWLRENLALLALVAVAVVAGLLILMVLVERFGIWLVGRSERRRASHGEARR